MGGGYPFEQLDTDKDWMDVNASSIISPSALATSNNQANNILVSHHSMEQQTGENIGLMDWMEYVQVRPSDTKTSSSSIPAAFHDNDNQLAAVSAPANKEFKANFQHDKTHYLARQAEQSNPMLAPLFMHHSNTPNARPVAFQLMDIVSDKQDLSFVEKVQVLEAEILKLCNTLAPASSKGKDNVIVSMDFDALNLQEASVIGFYGDKTFLTKIFKERNLAPSSLVISMQSNCLRSGLYACVDADSKLYLFYWDARDEFVEASRKDVSCNFVRYLMELCETVFVCVDGKAVGEVAMNEVTILSVQKQRTQRLQVSIRKESENDLKLRKGFNIGLDASVFHTDLMVGLPQGLHRCLVLSASLNKPKLVSRKDFKTERPANLKAWLVSQANSFSLDCRQLPDKDFLLLLRVFDKHEELQKHSQAEEMWKNKQLEVEKKLQHLDRIMKDKKTNLLSAFRSAMECMLLQKYPWEENLLANVDSGQTKLQEGTAGSASSEPSPDCSHLKHEATLCSVWSDQNDSNQRFLYPGSVVEMTSVEKDGESGNVFAIEMLHTQHKAPGKHYMLTGQDMESHIMVGHPICFGQHFMLTGKATECGADCRQQCIAYFSRVDGLTFSSYEPVILNGETKLILNLTGRNDGELVVVRHAGDGDTGLLTWLTAFCIGHMSLHPNAAAVNHLTSEIGSKAFDDKLLERLLQEPLKKWSELNGLPSKASTVIITFLSEKQDERISIEERISTICTSIYKDARQKSLSAVDAFVINEICPALREQLLKQLHQQKETMRKAHHIEAKSLLSNLKGHLFSPIENSSKQSEPKFKLCLLQLQPQSRSIMASIQYVFTGADRVTISYQYEELETETLTWRAIELVPQKGDLDELMSDPFSGKVMVPVCGRPTELITLNPKLDRLLAVVMVKPGHVLVFVEPVDKSCLHLYYYPRLGGSHMGANPSRTFKRGYDLWAFDEVSRFLALYDRKYGSIKAYRFDEAYQHMEWAGGDIELSKYSGSNNIVWMELVPGKREIVLVDDENRLRICELASSMMRARHIILPGPIRKACITPDASCLIVFSTDANSHGRQMDENDESNNAHAHPELFQILAHVYLLDDTLTLLKCLPIDAVSDQDMEELHAVCKYFGTQMQLVLLSSRSHGTTLMSYVIEVSSAQQTFQLQKVGGLPNISPKSHNNEQKSQLSSPALDYLFHSFDKYAVNPPLCSTERELGFCVLLHPPCPHWDDHRAKKNCEELIALSLRKLKKKGKVFNILKMQVSIETIQNSSYLEQFLTVRIPSESGLGRWMQKLLCLVPLQIARAENNTLQPMVNGLQIPSHATFSDAVSLASLLRFGPYDIILAGWKGEVKVISSMGKQSSGKSYLLNHLSGSLLDVAGGRCTDGVWMTVRCESDCLYVLLDFEGLGSFERSEQEDMFLSILNAAISNITIFNKKDFHMDKETEATFQRFQDGVSLVKADEKLFKGLFYMAIKDVDAADVEDLKSEFFAKISYICSKSNENFLVTMYDGQACVAALPPFQRPEFQESISEIGFTIQEINATYNNGRCFLEDLKLVLSQISARDWSSVDSKRVAMRLSVLRNHLESAIRLGQCSDGQCLLDFKEDENITDGPLLAGGIVASQVKDAGLELAGIENDSSSTEIMLQPLQRLFESIIQHHDGMDEEWHGKYQNFLDSLMERRQSRVLEWLHVNTLEFAEDSDVKKMVLEASTKLTDMRHRVQLCTCKCSKCFLLCILPKGHYSDHSCLGSHSCMQECSYCLDEAGYSGQTALECNGLAGHNGSHDCKKRTHTCEEPCIFSSCASNCNLTCSLRVDHSGDHRCNSIQHMCKEKCALNGCHNACIVPFELGQHDQHGCHEKVCPMQCSMPGCTRTCVTQNHFHDLEAGAQHFCAHEHPCPSKCESSGVCYVHTELLRQTRSFHGRRSDFEYDYVSEQSEDRKGCCLPVPPFMCSHRGSHTHSTADNVLHYCDVKCPACDYYCQLPFGHAGFHKTMHGNMRKMRFVAEVQEIDVQDRKYVRGESGVAEMCMMHCKARGRGHTHLAPCPEKEGSGCCTEKLYDGARHLVHTKCEGLDVEKQLDEMTHKTYWEYIRFVDPCEEAEKESFALCNHTCRSDEHNAENSNSGKSYCTEKLWHVPVLRAGAFQAGAGGYITDDGHHFTCNHSKISPHNVIFVMDKSGSMDSRDILPTMSMLQQSGHKNRLGCIYEAVLRFIKTRMQTTVASGLQIDDCISVVLFDTTGYVPVKLVPISEDLINQLLHYRAHGGTTYSSGLQMAEQILLESSRQPDLDKKGPMIIFLSDGGNNGGTDPVYMVQKLKQQEPRLVLHTIMFGKDSHAKILQDMARVGDGTYQLSLDEVQLARSFEGLARSLQPKIAALCSSS